jgi:nucleolar pre-ribosomal-associated protein 1
MLRESVIDILATLFNTHPSNTCQPSHIEPLLNLYHGTVSKADREILGVFQLFESQRAASVSSLFSRWSYSPGHNSAGTALDALRSLDSITVFRSCLSFPRSRRLTRYTPTARSTVDDRIYDPVFVLLLFSTVVQHQVPDSAMGWVELFRTNVVSLLISTLSAKDSEMRELAIDQLALLYSALEVSIERYLSRMLC